MDRPAAFLDRDGVLIRDHGYVFRPQDLEILPGVFEGLELLSSRGYLLILVSNQSGVARGLFSAADVDAFHEHLQEILKRGCGLALDGVYFCPHHPAGTVAAYARSCSCRKPSIGMLEQAGRDFAIDWSQSLMVGDKDSDIECAHAAGIRGFQIVGEQYETQSKPYARIATLADLRSYL